MAWPGGAYPVFERLSVPGTTLLAPGRTVARRYFAAEASPPSPPLDAFALDKPRNGFRLFVLGESSAAGFPYPHNGTFSRVLRDAMHDALPSDSVEVVNLGIAATNSFTLADLADEVIAQRPDAVLIYAGHNEYYGALGVGSSVHIGSSTSLARIYLALERWRTFTLLRNGVFALRRAFSARGKDAGETATLMEWIARDQQIPLGSASYRSGLHQFSDNVGNLLGALRDAHVPVFIASVASNVRDQRPFASPGNANAFATFDSGQRLLASHDTIGARDVLVRARDRDVVRFRAPSALNDSVRALAAAFGATYVPVSERIDSASRGGIPGHELFLEHVHPTHHGQVLIAWAFFDALRARGFLGRAAQLERVRPWDEYERRMELTPFDERIVAHTVRTVTTRWPFVERSRAVDYRGTYRPVGIVDSLAFLVSRGGMAWAQAKLRVANEYEKGGHPDSALAEYRGLIRDSPFLEPPYRFAGRALLAVNAAKEAIPWLEQARRIERTSESAYLLGVIALRAKDYDRAIGLLDEAVTLAPDSPAPLYQLSIAFGLSRNLQAARAAALRLSRLDPNYPGLAAWMATLGLQAR